jgi:16S rRNA (guanine(966)-N(2))-methyltransferase RsmD
MRVVAGKAKGRILQSVPGPSTRPVTSRAKTAYFDILGRGVVGAHFLDLFAGTGQVGIEALSRGAERAVFVEKVNIALRTIRANLRRTALGESAEVVKADVFDYLRRSPEPFHYIYVAPPQYRGLWKHTLRLLDLAPGWLTENGWLTVQIHPKEYEALTLDHFALFDQREYGSVMFCFYEKNREAEGAEG